MLANHSVSMQIGQAPIVTSKYVNAYWHSNKVHYDSVTAIRFATLGQGLASHRCLGRMRINWSLLPLAQ